VSQIVVTQLANAGTASSAVSFGTAGNLPANCNIVVDVLNQNGTPANLSTVTISSPNLPSASWTQLGTRLDGTASAKQRITRFLARPGLDLPSELITAIAANGQAQVFAIRIYAVAGAYVTGTNGIDGVLQTIGGDTAGANATTLSIPIAIGAANGALAMFVSTLAGTWTARTGWTTLNSTQWAAGTTMAEYIAQTDTAASATYSQNLPLFGMVSELRALTQLPIVSIANSGTLTGTLPIGSSTAQFPAIVRAKRLVFLIYEDTGFKVTSISIAAFPGVTATLLHQSGNDDGSSNARYTLIYQLTNSGANDLEGYLTATNVMNTAGVNRATTYAVVDVLCDLLAGTAGVVQTANTKTDVAATLSPAHAAFGAIQNCALMLVGLYGTTLTYPTGWRTIATIGTTQGASVGVRYTAPAPASVAVSGTKGGACVLVEIVPPPGTTSPPVTTLVSPPLGNIASTAAIVLNVTDPDADLASLVLQANGVDVFRGAIGGSFSSGFGTSTKVAIAGGYQLTVRRDGGWSVGGVTLISTPQDSRGQTTTSTFGFNVPVPTTSPPVVVLVSPPAGSTVAPDDELIFDITDPDGDVGLMSIVVALPDDTWEAVWAGGFAPAYSSSSMQTIAGGFHVTLARSEGWPAGHLHLAIQVADGAGHVAVFAADWTSVKPEPTPEPVPAAPSFPDEDIWLDVVSDIDRQLVTNGDWRTISGDDALKQSLIRRLITPQGEWRNDPVYGAGVGTFVGQPMTRALRDELTNRIRAQILLDDRVLRVNAVLVEPQDDAVTLIVTVKYTVRSKPLTQSLSTLVLSVGGG